MVFAYAFRSFFFLSYLRFINERIPLGRIFEVLHAYFPMKHQNNIVFSQLSRSVDTGQKTNISLNH